MLRPTLPAWRRAKERAVVDLRVAGEAPAETATLVSGSVSAEAPTILLIDDAQVVAATGTEDLAAGVWSSHPTVMALARAALQGLA